MQFHHRAVPIVLLINFLVGCIVAQQGLFQLSRFGAATFVVDLIGILVLRELAVLRTPAGDTTMAFLRTTCPAFCSGGRAECTARSTASGHSSKRRSTGSRTWPTTTAASTSSARSRLRSKGALCVAWSTRSSCHEPSGVSSSRAGTGSTTSFHEREGDSASRETHVLRRNIFSRYEREYFVLRKIEVKPLILLNKN